MKASKLFVVGGIIVIIMLTLALTVGLTRAQGIDQPQDPTGTTVVVPGAIYIQGRLTDASGTPLSGTYTLSFALYDVETGGTALCTQSHAVAVNQGLFNSYLDNCYNDLWGQKVWLGITVGSDAEMTPRQVIYPVPYALTLKPGALISGTVDGMLTVYGTGGAGGTADYDSLMAYAHGGGEAVSADAENGYGVYAHSLTNSAIMASTYNTATTAAIAGCAVDGDTTCNSYRDNNAAGVIGVSIRGDGLQGYATDVAGRGLYAANSGNGTSIVANSNSVTSTQHLYPTLYLIQGNNQADYVVGARTLYGTRNFRIDAAGTGYFNGGTQASGADFAEQIAVADETQTYAPGDVLVISAETDRAVERSSTAYSTAVIGVYSTQPGYLAGAPDTDNPLGGLPVAIVGIVPCKVSAENGAIQRGDLLVTSSTPGHAMRAGADPAQGTVLGKALGELKSGTGVIQILVTLQ